MPVKWRYLANSYAYVVLIPTNPLAAKIAFTFQKTPLKWRGSFIFMAGVNALSLFAGSSATVADAGTQEVLTRPRRYLFYHPPTFHMLHRKKFAKEILIHFDWIGLLLYTAGLLILLMGLSWGGGCTKSRPAQRSDGKPLMCAQYTRGTPVKSWEHSSPGP